MDSDEIEFPQELLAGYGHELDAAYLFIAGQHRPARNAARKAACSYHRFLSAEETDPDSPASRAADERLSLLKPLLHPPAGENGSGWPPYASALLTPGSAAEFFSHVYNEMKEYVPFYQQPAPQEANPAP